MAVLSSFSAPPIISASLDYAVIAHDLAAGTNAVIGYSAASGGSKAQISDNGRFVVFVSAADAPNTSAGTNHVFLYDLSEATWGVVPAGVTENGSTAICVDGTVAFSSQRFYRVTLVE